MTNTLLLHNLIFYRQVFFNARLAQADLITKTDFDVRLQSINKQIN